MPRAAGVLLLALVGSVEAWQGRTQQPSFRSDVELVQIDVVVVDEAGHPVRGLTKDDFTLRDRGKPQSLAAFQEIVHSYAPSPLASLPATFVKDIADNTTAQSDRLVVLAVDDMLPGDRLDSVKRLARQVVDRLGQGASMALLSTSNAREVEVTDNRALILEQIDRISSRSARAPRVARTTSVETGACAFQMFERAARMLAAEEQRRKAFVYISPFCKGDLKEVVRVLAESGSTAEADAEQAVIRMIEALRRANVAFYAIDPRGPQEYSLGHFPAPDIATTQDNRGMEAARKDFTTLSFDPVLQSQENLRAVTAATSGFAITNTADFESGIARLVDDFDHYYLLGFYPADPGDRRFRPVEVSVNRPGLTIRYRRGYQLGVRHTALPSNDDPLVTLSAGVLPRTELPLLLAATPRTPATSPGKTTRVTLTLEVRAPSAADRTPADDSLELRILAVDLEREKVTRTFSRTRPVRSAGDAYQVVTDIDLRAGRYQLRVSARSARFGKAGSVYTILDVPDYAKLPLGLGGLVLGDAPSGTITVMDTSTLPLPPTQQRVFERGDTLHVFCDVWQKQRTSNLEGTVALAGAEGAPVKAVKDGRIDAMIGLDAVAPGPYRLVVTVTDGSRVATRETGIVVR